jgi:hypothetical protein
MAEGFLAIKKAFESTEKAIRNKKRRELGETEKTSHTASLA